MTHEDTVGRVRRPAPRQRRRHVVRGSAAALTALALLVPAWLLVGAPATAAKVKGCAAAQLELGQGATEAATGHRYTRFRITNTGSRSCRLSGTPDLWYRNPQAKIIGFRSVPAGVAAQVVVLRPGRHTHVTLGRVAVPGPVPRNQCRPRRAVSVDLKLAYRPFVFNLPFDARVCTTRKYRPTAYPVGF